MQIQPPRSHLLRRHSRTPPPSFPPFKRESILDYAPPLSFPPFKRESILDYAPPLSFPQYLSGNPYWIMPPAVIPAVFKRESILDYADVNPAYANWISA